MQATSEERPHPAQTAAVLTTTLAALALLGLVLAYWTWAWLAPRPEPRASVAAPAGDRAGEPTQDAYALFGGARRTGTGTGTAPVTGAITLLGIVAAEGGRPGYALLRLDGRPTLAVPQGSDVEPGLRLVEVRVDHIVLERNGAREALAWPQKSGK